MQFIIVIAVLATAVLLAFRHFYKMLKNKSSVCAGCPLHDVCGKDKKKLTPTNCIHKD